MILLTAPAFANRPTARNRDNGKVDASRCTEGRNRPVQPVKSSVHGSSSRRRRKEKWAGHRNHAKSGPPSALKSIRGHTLASTSNPSSSSSLTVDVAKAISAGLEHRWATLRTAHQSSRAARGALHVCSDGGRFIVKLFRVSRFFVIRRIDPGM